VHDFRPIEEAASLLRCQPVLNIAILEDLGETPTAGVLPYHVGGDPVLVARPSEEEGEGAAQQTREALHRGDCILGCVRRKSTAGRFAERVLTGVDDTGAEERIVIWIERKPGALWAVGRAVNPQHRSSHEPHKDDYVFEGYELEDALESANATLEDDVNVLEQDGRAEKVMPFVRDELLKPLERYFFGHSAT
jgi:hypothetical protein